MNPSSEDQHAPPPLRRSLIRITIGGCLAMLYFTGMSCPALTEFFRLAGADDFHFGLLAGIPMLMLFMQFAGAAITNRVRHRKPVFMALMIFSRLLNIPLVFVPFLFRSLDSRHVVLLMLLLMAVSQAAMNMGSPPWFSWMADLIPTRILNSYWGVRQRWMQFTWAAAFVAVSAFVGWVKAPMTTLFPIVVVIAVAAGVIDILLFIDVSEPPNVLSRSQSLRDILLAPLRHAEYRTFVLFSCAWQASVMFAAGFMQIYALKVLHLPVWQATLIWCVSGIGNALAARRWGRMADAHGHKPVLAVCLWFKPFIALIFLLLTPATVLWVLPTAFLFDGACNAGLQVANNGYMMKIAPRQNRSMFIAAITGLAGVCGGLAAMVGGAFLNAYSDFSVAVAGRVWIHYHLLFALSFFLRVGCAVLIQWVREPRTSSSIIMLNDFLGVWPIRSLRFPVGLYRRTPSEPDEEDKSMPGGKGRGIE